MARYGRNFRGNRSFDRERNYVPHDYSIDYGYRRGDMMGSAMGRSDWGAGPGGYSGGWSGTAGRMGGGGPWNAYGSGEMGVTLGNAGRGGPRRSPMGRSQMRYDVGYGLGNDREWF